MNDLFPDAEIPLAAQIECVEREIRMRQRVYARRVDQRQMTQKQSDKELGLMIAVLKTLKKLQEQGHG